MHTVKWTTLGTPHEPRVCYVRGIGHVRVTEEDIDRYGESFLDDDRDLELERVLDDPEARFRISGPAPKQQWPAEDPLELARERRAAASARQKTKKSERSWLAKLFGR
jgi:hypothetical protein